MVDIISQIEAIHRGTGTRRLRAGDGRTVVLRRTFGAPVEEVWDALTNPDRLPRWFLPVTGDLRLGGRYQLEGNAGGEIVRCEPPKLFAVTWIYDPTVDDGSEVEVRLTPRGTDATELEMVHVAVVPEDRWTEFGPGAVGVGWDLALLGLGLHLERGESIPDGPQWVFTAEGLEFTTRSSQAWGAANVAGGASPEVAEAAERNTTRFYTVDPEAG